MSDLRWSRQLSEVCSFPYACMICQSTVMHRRCQAHPSWHTRARCLSWCRGLQLDPYVWGYCPTRENLTYIRDSPLILVASPKKLTLRSFRAFVTTSCRHGCSYENGLIAPVGSYTEVAGVIPVQSKNYVVAFVCTSSWCIENDNFYCALQSPWVDCCSVDLCSMWWWFCGFFVRYFMLGTTFLFLLRGTYTWMWR